MIVKIDSAQNNRIKEIRKLATKSYRQKTGRFMVEGIRIIEEAMQAHCIEYLVITEQLFGNSRGELLLQEAEKQELTVLLIENVLFRQLATTTQPQPILACAFSEANDIDSVLSISNPFFLLVDNLKDPGNLGTIIRTADAAGVDAVLLTPGCVDLYNPKTVRSTMGSMFHLPVIQLEAKIDIVNTLAKQNVRVIAGDLASDMSYKKMDYSGGIAVVVSNEAFGLSEPIAAISQKVIIPIYGKAESLNVASAASILLFEAAYQRHDTC